jgi:hypothetical protein
VRERISLVFLQASLACLLIDASQRHNELVDARIRKRAGCAEATGGSRMWKMGKRIGLGKRSYRLSVVGGREGAVCDCAVFRNNRHVQDRELADG